MTFRCRSLSSRVRQGSLQSPYTCPTFACSCTGCAVCGLPCAGCRVDGIYPHTYHTGTSCFISLCARLRLHRHDSSDLYTPYVTNNTHACRDIPFVRGQLRLAALRFCSGGWQALWFSEGGWSGRRTDLAAGPSRRLTGSTNPHIALTPDMYAILRDCARCRKVPVGCVPFVG